MIYNLWLDVIVTVFPKTITLLTVAKPETLNVGKSDKIATSIVKVVWFLLEGINMNIARSKRWSDKTLFLRETNCQEGLVSENSECAALEII